jgi:hypothetical protein
LHAKTATENLMKIETLAIFLLAIVPAVNAQRADCPKREAAMPMTPPGSPMINSTDELTAAEEGHLTGVARMVERAQPLPPADDVLRGLVDPRRTALSKWRFEGYVPDEPRHKVPRVFTLDSSVLVFEQWNMAADGAGVVATAPPTVQLGRVSAVRGGLKTPSGCVGASLSWHENGVFYSLTIVGPKPLQAQRDLLVDVARSIEAVAATSNQ